MKKIAAVLVGMLGLGLAYLLAWPVAIEPVAWSPPPAPALEGPYAVNDALKAAQRLANGQGVGPDAHAIDARNAAMDALAGQPFLRKVVHRLPSAVQPAPVMHAFVLALDPAGRVVANLQDATNGAYAPITSAIATKEHLYLGSLMAPSFARLPLRAP